MAKKLIIATHNRGKQEEFNNLLNRLLKNCSVALQSLRDYPDVTLPEENGDSYEDNAFLKASYIAKTLGVDVLADDSGLEVEALGDGPGIYSARYCKHKQANETQDQANNRLLLDELVRLYPQKKEFKARYVCALSLVQPYAPKEFKIKIYRNEISGLIVLNPRGQYGFGYDPYFYLPELGKTCAELTQEEKNQISHRGKALNQMMQGYC